MIRVSVARFQSYPQPYFPNVLSPTKTISQKWLPVRQTPLPMTPRSRRPTLRVSEQQCRRTRCFGSERVNADLGLRQGLLDVRISLPNARLPVQLLTEPVFMTAGESPTMKRAMPSSTVTLPTWTPSVTSTTLSSSRRTVLLWVSRMASWATRRSGKCAPECANAEAFSHLNIGAGRIVWQDIVRIDQCTSMKVLVSDQMLT